MSDHDSHTGPIKTPAQLLWTSFFSFVAPIFIIIGLVYYVTSGDKPAAGAVDPELATAIRIQRVGSVELRDANRPLQSGDAVYTAQCAACHAAGVVGAPKFGDAAAWAARIGQGYDTLLTSALQGQRCHGRPRWRCFQRCGNWPRRGAHGECLGWQVGRASGTCRRWRSRCWPPLRPEAAARRTRTRCRRTCRACCCRAVAAAAAPAAAATTVAAGAGEALYKQACSVCHVAGVAGAPKFGDKAAWAARVAGGVDALTASVIKGKGAMPPKGGSTASDADIKAAVEFMLAAVK